MLVFERIISVIAPHTCLGCGSEENRLLCDGCAQSLVTLPSRCYKCKAVTDEYQVCKTCAATSALHSVFTHTPYTDVAKELVHRMKFERAQQAATEIAQLLADRLHSVDSDALLAHVPTATSRVRSRGYDHAALLARALTNSSGLKRETLLARVGQTRQVGASRAGRLRQLHQAFRPLHPEKIRGAHIVLVDDVITTGATLETAARLLKRAGAKRVDAIVFAQA